MVGKAPPAASWHGHLPRSTVRSGVPSDLTARYLVLLLLVLAGAASVYGYLSEASQLLTSAGDRTCLSVAEIRRMTGVDPTMSGTTRGTIAETLSCTQPYLPSMLLLGAIGALLVGGATVAGYWLQPWWEIRYPNRRIVPRPRLGKGRLQELAQTPYADARPDFDKIARRLGMAQAPVIMVTEYPKVPRTFGTRRRAYVRFSADFIVNRHKNASTFEAVVLHEFAHVKNRDNVQTYVAIAAYWSFAALALAPYVAVLIVPGLFVEPLAWQPSDVALSMDNAHTTLAIVALSMLVVLSRKAMLRARELHADATAGRFDQTGAVRQALEKRQRGETATQLGPTPRHRYSAVVAATTLFRNHPTTKQRISALDGEPTGLGAELLAMFAAGVAVAVPSTDAILLGFRTLAATRPAAAASFESVLVVVYVGALILTTTVAWIGATTIWRIRLSRRRRLPPALLGAAFGLGLLVGEPLSITYANANAWGVFDGIGVAGYAGGLISGGLLVLIVVAAFVWTEQNAIAWGPVTAPRSGRLFAVSVAAGAIGLLPAYVAWWVAHDNPNVGSLFLWTPGFARLEDFVYWPGPAIAWLQAQYVPMELLGSLPISPLLIVAPVAITLLGLRPRGPVRANGDSVLPNLPDRRIGAPKSVLIGALTGLLVAAASMGLATWLRAAVGPKDLVRADRSSVLYYLASNVVTAVAVGAAIAAVAVWWRARAPRIALGLLAALTVVAVAAPTGPLVVLVALCGPAHAISCNGASFGMVYARILSVIGSHAIAKVLVGSLTAMAIVSVIGHLRRLSPKWRSHPLANSPPIANEDTETPSRTGVLAVTAVIVALVAIAGESAYFDLFKS